MARKAIESFSRGGVDSRSNPINEPSDRFLYCRNFVPKLDGELDLRDGYSLLNTLKTFGVTVDIVDVRAADITPTLALGTYYFQVAPVFAGQELGFSKVFGPVTLSSFQVLGVSWYHVPWITFSISQLADSWNIYFGTSATLLTQLVNIPSTTTNYFLGFTGNPAVTPVVSSLPIHSMIPYTTSDGTHYLLYWQGTVSYSLRISDMTVFIPPVKGTAVASSNRFTYALARNGHLLAFNGTDKKWFDGALWRDVGLGIIDVTTNVFRGARIVPSVRELTTAEAAAVILTPSAGGTFPADTVGRKVYISIFDTTTAFFVSTDEIGPATIFVGPAMVKMGTNQKLTIANLPNLASVNPNWIKLASITNDGGNFAFFANNTSAAITNIAGPQVTAPGHGLSVGDVVIISGNDTDAYNGVTRVLNVADANRVIVTNRRGAAMPTVGLGGTIKRIVSASNTGTSIVLNGPSVDTSYVVNQDRGIAPSVVEATPKGYQFALSIYNRTGGGHVGNWVPIGDRVVPTTRTNYKLVSSIASLLGDPELEVLVGRTPDGGAVPSVVVDSAQNWKSISSTDFIDVLVDESGISPDSEMPTRNGIPPAFDKVWREADKLCGVTADSPSVYRCGSEADSINGLFVGLPEQSWAPNDLETFPTADHVVCGASYNQESWCYSRSDMAMLAEYAGELLWSGPFNSSACGRFAFARGWQNQPYWISQDKQLMTVGDAGPFPISDEYEAALLSQIGDSYLSQTEPVYFRDASRHIDQLLIKCRDNSGTPFVVIHDFILRDGRSPFGQGYEAWYSGALTSDFTLCFTHDAGGRGQIWAGCANGNLYQLYSGTKDDTVEFTADAISLVYAGPYNSIISQLEWYGDPTLKLYFLEELDSPFDFSKFQTNQLSDQQVRPVPRDVGSSHYVVEMKPKQFTHGYLWVRLTSHSVDGDMSLSVPPHLPLENYGRIYGLIPLLQPTSEGK